MRAGMGGHRGGAKAEDTTFVEDVLRQRGNAVPLNFAPTARGYDSGDPTMQRVRAPFVAAFLPIAVRHMPTNAPFDYGHALIASLWLRTPNTRIVESWNRVSVMVRSTGSAGFKMAGTRVDILRCGLAWVGSPPHLRSVTCLGVTVML